MCQDHSVARLRPALGTLVAIEARSTAQESLDRAVEAGFDAIRDVERRLHPVRAGGDLARLNAARAGTRVPVHPTTVAILKLSRRLATASDGRFEPALPGQGSVLDWLPVGRDAVVVQRRAHVDLGGIAKGFAVDLAVEAMRRAGAHSGLVNAGGDLRVYGGDRWTAWLRDSEGAARGIVLQDCALAVSDVNSRDRPPEHRGYYSGRGAGRPCVESCAVMARRAALADGLTKVVMHSAPAQAAAILARFRARTIALGVAIVVST
jgi:FAD:protein FMN transferase